MKFLFQRADSNGDGMLSVEDYQKILQEHNIRWGVKEMATKLALYTNIAAWNKHFVYILYITMHSFLNFLSLSLKHDTVMILSFVLCHNAWCL